MSILSKITARIKKRLFKLIDVDFPQYKQSELLNKFLYVGKKAVIKYPWKCVAGMNQISLGDNFTANTGLFLGAYGENSEGCVINIGNNVVINYDSQITAINKIVIGDDVLTGSRIFISDHSHGSILPEENSTPPINRPLFSKGPVIIGNRVWIGSGVAILPNVTIGDECIIGANSVVTKSFPARSVIAGNPARLIKSL